jgi:hypothetical protein
MFAILFIFLVAPSLSLDPVAENNRLRRTNKALMAALRGLTEETESSVGQFSPWDSIDSEIEYEERQDIPEGLEKEANMLTDNLLDCKNLEEGFKTVNYNPKFKCQVWFQCEKGTNGELTGVAHRCPKEQIFDPLKLDQPFRDCVMWFEADCSQYNDEWYQEWLRSKGVKKMN